MYHMSPILAKFGGGAMSSSDPDIENIQTKLKNAGFELEITGELDECTCAALKMVGGPKELIEECGEMGAKGVKFKNKPQKTVKAPKHRPTKLEGPPLPPEVVQTGGLLTISAIGVAALWFFGQRQEKRRKMGDYSSIAEIQDVPFQEIEGEKVEYPYLLEQRGSNEATQTTQDSGSTQSIEK